MVDRTCMAGITLNSNFAERIGMRAMATHQREISTSLERLSTGKQINRASDDPAGLISSEALKSQQKGVLAKIQGNVRDGHRFAAIEGGLSAVQDLLLGLKSNVVQAANTAGLSREEREALQTETNGIIDGLEHLGSLQYNGELILAPYIGALGNIQTTTTGAGGTTINVSGGLSALRSGGTLNLVNGNLEQSDAFVEAISKNIAESRGAIGAVQKGLDHENAALATQNENLSAAISQIVDTDYASEVGNLVRSQAMAEAARYAVQASRDLQAQTVLDLIKGQLPLLKRDGTRNA
jgi:flagellin